MARKELNSLSSQLGNAEIIHMLKKRNRPSYGKSSIFLMDSRLWRSTGNKGYSLAIFGQSCEVS